MDRGNLRLSTQRALLGRVHPDIRLIKVKASGFEITLTVVVANEPSQEIREDVSEAAAEIVADFPEVTRIVENIETSQARLNSENIVEEGWVYRRAE